MTYDILKEASLDLLEKQRQFVNEQARLDLVYLTQKKERQNNADTVSFKPLDATPHNEFTKEK